MDADRAFRQFVPDWNPEETRIGPNFFGGTAYEDKVRELAVTYLQGLVVRPDMDMSVYADLLRQVYGGRRDAVIDDMADAVRSLLESGECELPAATKHLIETRAIEPSWLPAAVSRLGL